VEEHLTAGRAAMAVEAPVEEIREVAAAVPAGEGLPQWILKNKEGSLQKEDGPLTAADKVVTMAAETPAEEIQEVAAAVPAGEDLPRWILKNREGSPRGVAGPLMGVVKVAAMDAEVLPTAEALLMVEVHPMAEVQVHQGHAVLPRPEEAGVLLVEEGN